MGDDVYYVYIVRCEDDSLYTGIATDEYRIKCLSHEGKLALVERPARADSIVPGAGALAESLGQRRAFRTVPRPTRVCWWCTAAGEQGGEGR